MQKCIILSFVFVILSGIALGQVPQLINYQGLLIDPATDQPVPDPDPQDPYSIVFSIYDTPTARAYVWRETHSVETRNGWYSVLLGTITPLTAAILSGPEKYLGIKVGEDPEMTPRKRIVSVAYAIVTGNADSLGGKDATEFATKAELSTSDGDPPNQGSNQVSWDNLADVPDGFADGVDNTVGGGGNTLDQAYDQSGPGQGRTITADAGAVNIAGADGLTVEGKVGIGTTNPISLLDIRPATSIGLNVEGIAQYTTRVINSGNTAAPFYAGYFRSNAGGAATASYGVWGQAAGASAQNIGGYFRASGGTENFAIYSANGKNYFAGNIGIGTTNPQSLLSVGGAGGSDVSVYGEATDTGDVVNYGGYFIAKGREGRGVYGEATNTGEAENIGGFFVANGMEGRGVLGKNNSTGTAGALGGSSYGVWSQGDLWVTGAYRGNIGPNGGAPFPRPAYDSGYIPIDIDETITLYHSIGGNIDNYVVEMHFKYLNGTPHAKYVGGAYYTNHDGDVPVYTNYGAYWSGLTTTQIKVHRFRLDVHVEEVRIRIWYYE